MSGSPAVGLPDLGAFESNWQTGSDPTGGGGNPAVVAITGTASAETLNGTSGDDLMYGVGGNDTLNGLAGNDQISGGDGNDTIDGGTGADIVDGGPGVDTASYAGLTAPVVVSLALSGAQDTSAGGIDTLISIENLTGGAAGCRADR